LFFNSCILVPYRPQLLLWLQHLQNRWLNTLEKVTYY
jgi:hypothetical protein